MTLLSALLTVSLAAVATVPRPALAAAAPEVKVAPAARSERLELILKRGSLIVGVKTDYPPFGMTDGASASQGFEHDLAAEIARRLGVGLSKVGVSATNRLQRLQDGSIDLVIATTGDTGERRRIVTMVEPNYYASGVTLFMPPHERARDWPDIRGKTVCGTQGAYFNRTMQERYLFDLALYTSPRDARLAVKNGRCIGFLFDNTAVVGSLAQPEWDGWHAPLPPALNTPWAMAIAPDEKGSEFERRLGDIVAEWHRSGWLIEREHAWGIPPSRFLAEMHALWRGTGADGAPLCRRGADGNWPAECRNSVLVTSAEVTGLARLGRLIHERSGVDLMLVYDPYDRSRFLRGVALTLVLTLACVLGSLACGIAGALAAAALGRPRRLHARTHDAAALDHLPRAVRHRCGARAAAGGGARRRRVSQRLHRRRRDDGAARGAGSAPAQPSRLQPALVERAPACSLGERLGDRGFDQRLEGDDAGFRGGGARAAVGGYRDHQRSRQRGRGDESDAARFRADHRRNGPAAAANRAPNSRGGTRCRHLRSSISWRARPRSC